MMIREERLLERIRSWEREPGRRVGKDTKRIIDSVLSHLQRVLNTRRGSVPIAEDYGVPDFTNLLQAYPESLMELERSIRQTIQKYEPRLKAVRVNFLPQDEDMLSLRFQIVARLVTEDERVPVLFESLLGTDGKIQLRR